MMTTKIKRWLTVACTCSLLLFLPGCWDYEAINSRSAVIGLGIDPAEDSPEKILVTIQFPVLTKGGLEGKQGGESSLFQELSTESDSLTEAFKDLQRKMDRAIDIAELRAVVVSGHLSGKLMGDVVGQLMRLPRMNRLAFILMTPESAQKIMGAEVSESAPMDFVERTFKVRQHGYVARREVWQYWRDATQVGIVPVMSILKTEGTIDSGEPILAFSGVAVYQNNKPVLSLSKEQTLYVNFMLGKVRDMSFDVPMGDGVMSLTDVHAKSRIRCINQGHSLVLIDHVHVVGTLGKIADPSPKPLPPTNVIDLERQTSQYLKSQLTSTLEALQQHQLDVVGFGRIYLQGHPEEENRLKQQWGEMFAHAKLDIQVDVRITSKGVLI